MAEVVSHPKNMNNSRGNILWVDDEIDHLKPHILFLEEKGYQITPATNGSDALELVRKFSYHLVLLDHFMPGMDGMATLRELNTIRPNLPVIMITKSEEEWLMDEAISEKIAHFLIKPVNPTQIFMACKQILEKTRISEDKVTSDYLKEFQDIENRLQTDLQINDWWELYNRLVKWQLNFDEHKDTGLGNILTEQVQTCNREFVHFIQYNYTNWLKGENKPSMSVDVIPRWVAPRLSTGEKICFVLIDGMRLDQWMTILPEIGRYFDYEIDYHLSLLPSATPFSRNAIFSGLYPDHILAKYPQQLEKMKQAGSSLNLFEELFLKDQLRRLKLENAKILYHKIHTIDEGQKFNNHVAEYLQVDCLAVVVNFVDMLAHKRSESDVLQEMMPDESGYRFAVKTWFENSWLFQSLKVLSNSEFTVVLTSDHGTVRVQRGAIVGADRETSSGIRYKYGYNLNCTDKNALVIKQPHDYRLPELGHQTNYLIAKDDIYFLYPTQYHRYLALYKNSFQHGGISLEELFVPVITMHGKGR
ncbi:MAG: response regulator [Candidatus Marinimicrobia bacterium]|nr:response regulator [Candidatus Neomarinimicrobiota bacterium]